MTRIVAAILAVPVLILLWIGVAVRVAAVWAMAIARRHGRWAACGLVFIAALARFAAEVVGWVVFYGWLVTRARHP